MRHALGRSPVSVSDLGFGAASIGNLFRKVDDDQARATVDAAWQAGIRYFDTAPHYGLGLSERRLGRALAEYPRDSYVISTKVGRLLETDEEGVGTDLANGFDVPATHRRVWDFSSDGVLRSIEASLDRLGVDRIDIALLHDPDRSPDPSGALTEGYPALHRMRAEGVVGAIGVGSMNTDALDLFAAEADVDVLMVAGRYTLLEQPALDTVLPTCARRDIAVVNASVFNSGLLAVDRPDASAPYEYGAPDAGVLDRAQRIAAVCRRHGISLPQAALAFARAHPAVAAVIIAGAEPAQVAHNAALFARADPPASLWADLVADGLLRPDAPVPA